MLEVTKYASEEALQALWRGFANFFAGRAEGLPSKPLQPKSRPHVEPLVVQHL